MAQEEALKRSTDCVYFLASPLTCKKGGGSSPGKLRTTLLGVDRKPKEVEDLHSTFTSRSHTSSSSSPPPRHIHDAGGSGSDNCKDVDVVSVLPECSTSTATDSLGLEMVSDRRLPDNAFNKSRFRTQEDPPLDYDSVHDGMSMSSSVFEFQKAERGAQRGPLGPFSKPAPSKWDDAQKWIASPTSNRPKMGLAQVHGEQGIGSRKTASVGYGSWQPSTKVVVEVLDQSVVPFGEPDTKRIDTSQAKMNSAGTKCVSWEDDHSYPIPDSYGQSVLMIENSVGESAINLSRHDSSVAIQSATTFIQPPSTAWSVSMRDMGTEMTPIASQEPSRTGTPVRATTPIRSPTSSRPSTPARAAPTSSPSIPRNDHLDPNKNELSEKELQMKTRKEIMALGTQLGKMNIAAWASKGGEDTDASSSVKSLASEQPAKSIVEPRAAAWEEVEKTKYMARFKREEMKIQAWENHQKAKTEAEMRKIEDLVTLDEAVKTANNAVLLAVNAISVLISETHRKLIDVAHNDVKEVQVSELIEILESYKEAKVGFGAGYNAKTSILQSLYDCPFLGVGVKDLNGVVVCVLASSNTVDKSDAFLRTFRQTTEYTGSIILSMIHEPNLEPNLLLTTVLIVGNTRQQSSQKSSILSTLARHIPFVFDLLRRHHPQLNGTEGNHLHENAFLYEERDSGDSCDGENGIDVNNMAEDNDRPPENFQTVGSSNDNEFYASRNYDSESDKSEVGLSETSAKSTKFYNAITEGTPAFQREPLVSWNLRPAYEIAKEWAKERAADTGTTPLLDNLSILHLPVGVRPSVELKDNANISLMTQNLDPETEGDAKAEPVVNSSISSWSDLTDAGLEAVKDFCNNTFTSFKGEYVDITKKQGDLSVRAASMLEAERDSPKKWSPIVEMPYRGGFYRGRCQGGLPEGKGRLVLGDGSIYDGIWHYGKRSGLGTFYFSNGDVFQGSWREDVMHGKGWFYFHTGDRWFANFWKGKANGEGRFYSKSGDVFFGHFQDGWRHGQFLCIDINGTRSLEIWDQGIIVSCKQLDTDADAG